MYTLSISFAVEMIVNFLALFAHFCDLLRTHPILMGCLTPTHIHIYNSVLDFIINRGHEFAMCNVHVHVMHVSASWCFNLHLWCYKKTSNVCCILFLFHFNTRADEKRFYSIFVCLDHKNTVFSIFFVRFFIRSDFIILKPN